MESLSLNADSLMAAMAASYVHRLRDLGISFSDALSISEKAAERMVDRMEETQSRAAESIAILMSHGVRSAEMFNTNAAAVFSIAGVNLADEMFKSLIAERN